MGTTLGRYVLLDRISAGGMAEVYRARMRGVEGFERMVAVKQMLPSVIEDTEFVQTLVDEAKLTVLLSHSSIAQTFDLGRESGALYLAMEYVSGRDLRSVLNRMKRDGKRFPIPMACYVIARLADALDYAHGKRDADGNELHIVHRDVSPSNVMISYEGDVKLIDFGIARAATRVSLTSAGVVKGKVAYMAPEQARGELLDHKTDIYAAGVVLWELLTGVRMFQADSEASLIRMVAEGRIQRPSAMGTPVDPALEETTMRALEGDRARRFQRAGELRDALQLYLLGKGERTGREEMAALMQQLFPEEITRERELAKAVAEPEPPTPEVMGPITAQLKAAEAMRQSGPTQLYAPSPSRWKLWTGIAVGLVASAGVVGAIASRGGSRAELVVTVEPREAWLFVDGKLVKPREGVALIDNLPPGTYALLATHEGHQDLQEAVELKASEHKKMALKLVPKPARLTVVTSPPAAALSVGGTARGETPATLELTPGSTEVAVKLKCAEERRTLDLRPGEVRSVELKLDTAKCDEPPAAAPVAVRPAAPSGRIGWLQLTSWPPGKVIIDGKPLGKKTPLVKEPLAPGEHRVRVEAPGSSKEVTVEIAAGKTEPVFLTLE